MYAISVGTLRSTNQMRPIHELTTCVKFQLAPLIAIVVVQHLVSVLLIWNAWWNVFVTGDRKYHPWLLLSNQIQRSIINLTFRVHAPWNQLMRWTLLFHFEIENEDSKVQTASLFTTERRDANKLKHRNWPSKLLNANLQYCWSQQWTKTLKLCVDTLQFSFTWKDSDYSNEYDSCIYSCFE